jgi:hypothetical protein
VARVRTLLEFEGERYIDWYVVFGNTGERHWWNHILKQGFQHCWALRRQGDLWIIFHTGLGVTETYAAMGELEDVVRFVDDRVIIRVSGWVDTLRIRVPWVVAPQTCVEQVKSLLGIRAFWVLTPYQLYRHLGGADG